MASQATAQKLETPDVIIPAATALALHEAPGALAIPESLQSFTGAEGLTDEDLIIPRYKIVQPTSNDGTTGMLVCNILGNEVDSLKIVVVKIDKGRAYWEKDKFDKPLCRSNDYMVPDPSIENPLNPVCAIMMVNKTTGRQQPVQKCKFGSWDGDAKPPCSLTYNLLAISLEDMMPFWISLHGNSIKPVKQYSSSILLRRQPFWRFQTTFSTALRTEPKKHYVAKFEMPKAIPDEQLREIMESVQALMRVSIQRTFEYEDAQADEAAVAREAPGEDFNPPGGTGEDNDMPAFMNAKKE